MVEEAHAASATSAYYSTARKLRLLSRIEKNERRQRRGCYILASGAPLASSSTATIIDVLGGQKYGSAEKIS